MRVLVIEGEPKLAKAVKEGLEDNGYQVTLASTGEDGFFLLLNQPFDLLLLDVMLPGRDGLAIVRSLRTRGLQTPVLLLTARDTLEDRVGGLDAGADDYLVKPFAFPELLARMRALLRRGPAETTAKARIADLEIDLTHRHVSRAGQPIDLTAKEYDILAYLCRNSGQVVSREMLARDVWKDVSRHTPLDNVIDVHLAHLRRKVDDRFSKKLLHTVRGLGFVLREESR